MAELKRKNWFARKRDQIKTAYEEVGMVIEMMILQRKIKKLADQTEKEMTEQERLKNERSIQK